MKTKFHEFNLTSTYKGDKCWDAEGYSCRNYNNHIITVYNTRTRKATRFEFWESLHEIEIRTRKQLIWAFECFLSDALSAIQNEDEWDFFDEYGYTPSRKAKEIYEACKRSARKAKRVVGDEQRICDLINEINGYAQKGENMSKAISDLTPRQQKEIRKKLRKVLRAIVINPQFLTVYERNAMSGRLSDIADLIDVAPYI